jgi:hypothetical protein
MRERDCWGLLLLSGRVINRAEGGMTTSIFDDGFKPTPLLAGRWKNQVVGGR